VAILHVDAETGFSGGEVQVFLLLDGLRRRGHECVLVCPPGSRCEREADRRGLATRAVSMRNDLDVAAVLRLRSAIRSRGPDLVHLHTGRAAWLGGLAAALAGVPAIATRRMDRPVRPGLRRRILHGRLLSRAVAISPGVAAQLARGGVPAERIRTIPSAVDPAALLPSRPREATRAAEGAPPDAPVLLALAALVRRKGLDVLLDALALVPFGPGSPAPHLWIAGDGPERAALEGQARRLCLGDRVRFLGRREDAPDLLAACDAFVLPSRQEGLGVAALEAMAAGRPVVATRVGGLGDAVVDGRTGLLVPPDDAKALAEALVRLLASPTLRAELSAEGPKRIAEGFLAEQMVDAYEALYREVLAERRPGR
jgi:glycosyltransferase involved in cell wall biosynthesis